MSTQQLLMSYGVTASSNQPYTAEFLTATGIADATIISALNQLEIDLTTAGLIDYNNPSTNKFNALYPMVGGTASTHKYNFLDAQDTDTAFRLTFSGGWTHSSTGALPNGTNGYADTHLSCSGNMTVDSTHISFYSRTSAGSKANYQIYDGSFSMALAVRYSGLGIISDKYFPTSRIIVANSDGQGFYLGTRPSSTSHVVYKNGVSQGTSGITNAESLVNLDFYLGCVNFNGSPSEYTDQECAFTSLGAGLDSTESTDLYNAVQDFQTTLSRNV